ncbi:unnamed protein product [Gongylonema pulchrum]|uniref:Protein kinase domain-containing protein n=1 Tax=Gongylonema pulchrum TaxID=637853 RepID=A0A183EI94_9BILA|nr:unnamed protein product [Gongylonema pulchrum]
MVFKNLCNDYSLLDSWYECLEELGQLLKIPETLSKLLTDEKLRALKVEKAGDDDDGSDQSIPETLSKLLTDEKLRTLKVEKTGDDDDDDGSDQSVFVMLFELITIHPSLAIDMLKGNGIFGSVHEV